MTKDGNGESSKTGTTRKKSTDDKGKNPPPELPVELDTAALESIGMEEYCHVIGTISANWDTSHKGWTLPNSIDLLNTGTTNVTVVLPTRARLVRRILSKLPVIGKRLTASGVRYNLSSGK